eukprot:1727179-Prymnesium_polylepis.1
MKQPLVLAALVVVVAATLAAAWRHSLIGEALLLARVELHIEVVHAELQQLFDRTCAPERVVRVPPPAEQEQGNINVPSCAAFERVGLQSYYGNLNMLLVEAWQWKILPTLRAQQDSRRWWRRAPRSELLTVQSDGRLAGAIFVQQLLADDGARLAPSALM